MNLMPLIITAICAMIISTIATGILIPLMKKKQFGQYIREEGPASHLSKAGTPTMGGIAIVGSVLLYLLISRQFYQVTWVSVAVMMLFFIIGFLDDYKKISGKQNLGLTAKQKIILQVLFAIGLAVYGQMNIGSEVWFPFVEGRQIDLGYLYGPFVVLVVVAMANSVNLTDGLDGLCGGVTAIVAFFFGLLGTQLKADGIVPFVAAVSGACLGYLVFNKYPAKVFMGDTGSMALGGALAAAAVILKMEFMLVIAGFIYVIESLSVIIQVTSFKLRGKRVFKMSPIHHHFELCGMKEQYVVLMFWGLTVLFCGLGWLVYSM